MTFFWRAGKGADLNTGLDNVAKSRILIVDDNPTVRGAITLILNSEPDLSVCGEAHNVAEAIERSEALLPDLALIDISLKGDNGLDLARHLREHAPSVRMVALSLHDDGSHIDGARRAGCHGYAIKGQGPETLLACIRGVLGGHEYFADPEQP